MLTSCAGGKCPAAGGEMWDENVGRRRETRDDGEKRGMTARNVG